MRGLPFDAAAVAAFERSLRATASGDGVIAALALCRSVEVYGVGLLSVGGVGGELVESRFYDQRVGRCAEAPRSGEIASRSGEVHAAGEMRAGSKASRARRGAGGRVAERVQREVRAELER